VDDPEKKVSNNGGRMPVWGPDSRELFYLDDQRLMKVRINVEPYLTADIPELLFEGPYLNIVGGRTYDVSSDGQRFLMIKESTPRVTDLVVVLDWFEELERQVPTGRQ
jgi:hypothetical protein